MQPKSAHEPCLVDVRGVARLYSISDRSVWRLCKQGQIPAPVQLGQRATRWRLSDLVAHIGRMEPAAPHNNDTKQKDTSGPA